MNIIEFDNVCEKYRIKFIKKGKVSWEEIWALNNISFQVYKGEVLGIIGENGAGKTTLLKLIAGILMPDKGTINVYGKVSTLMELGAGFNPEFTGRENIFVNARIYGVDEERLQEKITDIIEFAGLDKFIDAPIKYYSQGMYMRLAFALAIYVEPDILLIDDILAVGDEEAQQKCIKKILELKDKGKTIILVSHDMNMVSRLCNRVIILERGKIVKVGLPESIVQCYLESIGDKKGIAVLTKSKLRTVFNNGRINITYDDNILTKGVGGYVSYLIPSTNTWFSSLNLSWHIKNLSYNTIIAEGITSNGSVAQVWNLQIEDNNLKLQIEIKEDITEEARIDLLLIPQYKKWLTLNTNGTFPSFINKFNLQELDLIDAIEGILGLMPDQTPEIKNLPSFIIETEDKDVRIKLFNTGDGQETRIIQIYYNNKKFISIDIKIFPENNKIEDYLENIKNNLLAKQKEVLINIRESRTISCGDLRLFVDKEHKAIRLYYKDNEITKGSGLHTSFLINKSWYDLTFADWQITKQQDLLLLSFKWSSFDLTQTWKVHFDGNRLLWEVDIFVNEPLNIDLMKFGLFLTPDYKTFFCGMQQQDFPDGFSFWEDMPLNDPQSGLFGLRKHDDLPAITLKNNNNLTSIIQNSDLNASCRSLQLGLNKETIKNNSYSITTEVSILEDDTSIDDYIKEEKEKLLLKQKAEEQQRLLQRTISCGDLRLFVDKEHKAIRLYYKDNEITKGSGLHTSFLINKSWYDLTFADWQITKQQDLLLLSFKWSSFDLTQTWKVHFDGNRLLWEVDIFVNEPLNIDLMKFGLFLTPDYKTFFCGMQQQDFPDGFSFWEDMPLNDPQSGLFGLRKHDDLPAITLKNNNNLTSIIQNSDLNASCRSLQLGLNKETIKNNSYSITTEVSILEDDTSIDDYIKEEKEKLLLKQKAEEQQRLLQRTISCGDLRLFVDKEHKAIRLYYKDNEITKGSGLHTSFYASQQWFNLYNAKWDIHKTSETELTLTLTYESLLLLQIWHLSCKEDNTLEIKIKTHCNKQIFLTTQSVIIELQDNYKRWLTAYECGNFLVNQYINNLGPIRLKDSKVSKVLLESDTDSYHSQLYFEAVSTSNGLVLSIYKCKEKIMESVYLNFSLVIPKKEELISLDRDIYFEGKIILDKDIKLGEESVLANCADLKKDALKFIFEEGKGRIFLEQKELTVGLGLYTSVRSSGIWYDSHQAVWQINQKEQNKIIAWGDWPYLPISQIWQIELSDKNVILFSVDMEIYEEVNLEIEQTSLMFNSEYKTWIIPGVNEGNFLDEYTQDYDIIPFRFWYGKPTKQEIIAINNGLPPISFICNLKDEFLRAVVGNTDYLYKARLLQYQKCNTVKLLQKKYTYFSGVIKIGH